MKSNMMLALYNEYNNLIGYFHDDAELDEYISFLNKRNIKTDNWRKVENYFEG